MEEFHRSDRLIGCHSVEPTDLSTRSISNFLSNVVDSSSTTVKEAQKQRNEAKLIKQLEKQKQQEAAEKAKLKQTQHRKGKLYHRFMDFCLCPHTCE